MHINPLKTYNIKEAKNSGGDRKIFLGFISLIVPDSRYQGQQIRIKERYSIQVKEKTHCKDVVDG